MVGAGAFFTTFVAVELRVAQPMLPLSLFRRRDFTAAQVAAFAISASFFALYLYMTLYLQNVLRLSPLDAGLVYLPGSLLLFVASAAGSKLTERFQPAALVTGGLALVAGGLALLGLTAARSSWTVVLPGDLVVCLGTGIFNPALAMIAVGAGPAENSGVLAGVNDAARQGGIAVGVAIFGALVPASAALGHGSSADYVAGFHHALIVGTAIAAAGAAATAGLLAVTRRPTHSRPRVAVEAAADIA